MKCLVHIHIRPKYVIFNCGENVMTEYESVEELFFLAMKLLQMIMKSTIFFFSIIFPSKLYVLCMMRACACKQLRVLRNDV